MRDLIFLPLDITISDIEFEVEDKKLTFHQASWDTRNVLGRDNNYKKYRWLLDQLPIVQVNGFTHKIQLKATRPHFDMYPDYNSLSDMHKHIITNEPAGYHVVLKGQPNSLEVFDGKEWVNPILPEGPMAYLLNLTSCLHRVKEDQLRETLYIYGQLDVEKHNLLIERNLKKYGDLAIYKKLI
jgi:hypothetical protein